MYSKELYEQVIQLSKSGLGAKRISKIIGIPPSTIHHWIRGEYKTHSVRTDIEIADINFRKTRKIANFWKGKTREVKPFTEEHKRKIGDSNRGNKNGQWKGDKANKEAGRARARRIISTDEKHEIHHINGNTLDNSPENLLIVTRKEHMVLDGRINNLKQFSEEK